jgi:serine/threonine-protein kinase
MQGVIVFTRDPGMAEAARNACRIVALPLAVAGHLAELAQSTHGIEWSELVIDREHPDAAAAASQVGALSGERRLICVLRDVSVSPLPGSHVVVLAPVLGRTLVELATPRTVRVPSALERLLGVSVLEGPIEEAIDAASHELAVAFGVARCLISERAEPAGAVLSEGATFDAQAWNLTAQRCRNAVNLDATLVVPAPQEPGACDSYVACGFESPRGEVGFVALIATGARVFGTEERARLRAIANRLGRELHARTATARTAEELDRALSGPGLDPLLGVWNRAALDQIVHSYVSSSKRYKLPLAILAVRIVNLEAVNTRHGMAMGDRLLRRVADALKPALRGEDLVGRFSGTVLAVVLQGTGPDDARRVAERIHATLGERTLELPDGAQLHVASTIGISALRDGEDATHLLTRTARATKLAPDNVVTTLSAPTTLTGRIPQPGETGQFGLRMTLGGSYRLRHEISRGGMGVVYRADDLALERPVAIKMLRPELAQNEELVKHLRREASLLARVHHRNLVQIYNFGHAEGDCYFVMELVEGESLQAAIDRHRAEQMEMPIIEMLGVVEQVGSALDALHERGIVHRDVKPANFIRDPFTNRSVLVDVGIAHRYGELSKQAGTPGFMAPEVIQGVAASTRSDVYGLAASVFAMATLSAPWGEGEPIEIIMRQCNEAPPRASSLRAGLEPIDEILADAMSFEVDRRPATAGTLARALSRALGTITPRSASRTNQNRASTEVGRGATPRTRGVVFRSVPRAIGVRDADLLRDAIGQEHPELAQTLSQAAPLAWERSDLFVQLLSIAPKHLARDPMKLAREIARAAVRASFHNFFPASPETLDPDRTLSAIRGIWSRYHTWGSVAAITVKPGETVVRLSDSLHVAALCEWTCELLENLVQLSGGREPRAVHESCEIDGADACSYRVTWHE